MGSEIFSAGGGRFARVFVGEAAGWFAGKGVVPTPEELVEHLDDIRSLDNFTVPGSAMEEANLLMQALV